MFPEKSSKGGEIKGSSVCVMESDRRVDVKVMFLSELGMCAGVCVSVCAWEAAGVASITSPRPHPPVQGIARLPSPSNPFADSSQRSHKAVFPTSECTLGVCVQQHSEGKTGETNTNPNPPFPECCRESKDELFNLKHIL